MQLWQFKRKIHISWLIACASVSIVFGVALVPTVDQSQFADLLWLIVGIGFCGLVLWRKTLYLVPLIIVGGFIIGLWRGSILDSRLTVYQKLIGATMTVRGVVSDDPDSGEKGETLIRLHNISLNGHVVAGNIWLSTDNANDIKRGDYVNAKGKLTPGFGSFAASMYRAEIIQTERPEPGDIARQVRDWFADNVRLAINEPQSSLGLGYLLGQRRALPPELDEALVIAGLTHVVVASGYNLTILVRFARRLFVKISKYLAALSAIAMIAAFIAITGASPSMSRAGLVAGLSLAAWYYGRKFHPLVLLPFAAAVTVIINPAYAWNDLGWQLSFTAFAGVMILAPLLQRYFYGDKKPGTIRQILGETISASIMTLPILVFAFGQFSNVALIANLLILPLVPLAMLLTFAAGIGAVAVPSFAGVIGLPAQYLLTYMTSVAEYFAGLPWALTIVAIDQWAVWLAYVIIGFLCVYFWRVTKYDLKKTNIVE